MAACDHISAENHGELFHYPDGTEAGYLCYTCAIEAGFCPWCGGFIAGSEVEESYMHSCGCCSDCLPEFYTDEDEFEDVY